MKPYLVSKVLAPSGAMVSETSPQIFGRALSSKAAKKERSILESVVENGTGGAAQIGGAKVIGKTGTAETGKSKPDAWFVGTASANGKSVTIALVIEEGESGGDVAAPRASNVLYTALEEVGGF
jgi:peptidoglycan glycosyltransferase